MMIASVVVVTEVTLEKNISTELSAPDDQRLGKQPPLGKVYNRGSGCLIGIPALCGNFSWQTIVLIPSSMKQLNKVDPVLNQSPR